MSRTLFLTVLGLLTLTACVQHDPDPVEIAPEYSVQREPEIVVQQPQAPRTIVVRPAQTQQVKTQQQAKPTWWQTNRQKHTVKVVVPTCPCKDPNDPCTHCYQK